MNKLKEIEEALYSNPYIEDTGNYNETERKRAKALETLKELQKTHVLMPKEPETKHLKALSDVDETAPLSILYKAMIGA